MPRAVIPIHGKTSGRTSNQQFRLVEKILAHHNNKDSVKWASCAKPEPTQWLEVTNTGTSFARVVPSTPNFSRSTTFSQPCKGNKT